MPQPPVPSAPSPRPRPGGDAGPGRAGSGAGLSDLRQQLQLADQLRETGQLEAAEAAYHVALARAPRNPRALLGLGFTARLRKDPEAALAWFRRAAHVTADSDNVNPTLYMADTLRDLGRLDAADRNYQAVLDRAPANLRALMGLALDGRHRRDPEAAAALFRRAAEANTDPANVAPDLSLAEVLRELGRVEEADAACRAALQRAPDNPRALAGLGFGARARKDHRAALEWFERAAASTDPANGNPALEVAHTLRELGRLDAADAACRAVLERVPGHPRALVGLALNARLRGDRDAALDRLREAVAADPDNLTATLELATELRDRDLFGEATASAEAARARHPDDHRPWLSLAQTRRRAGDHEDAHRILVVARVAHPDEIALVLEQAMEERWLGRPHAAEVLLRQVVERDPTNLMALGALTQNASVAGELDRALALLDDAVGRQPANSQLCALTAQALADAGRHDDALDLLRRFEETHGADTATRLRLAALLQGAGLWEEALDVVTRAAADAPLHFGLRMQGFALERFLNGADGLDARLRDSPVGNSLERAIVLRRRGNLREEAWDFDAAIRLYEEALRFNEHDSNLHHDLTRAALAIGDVDRARRHLGAFARAKVSTKLLQNQSTNMSQTHLGQLLDEYALNEHGLAALSALRDLPPDARIDRLLALVRREPDYSPGAIGLLVALRQAGYLALPREAGKSPIPRRIMQYWDAPTPPDDVLELSVTWREMNPGYEYHRFSDGEAMFFLARHLPADVYHAYRRSVSPAQKADLFRLAWLYVAGGVYADMDDRCRAPVERILPPGVSLVLFQEELCTIGNNFLAAAPRSPVIGLALRMGVDAINRGDHDLLWLSTGPALLTRAYAREMAAAREPWRDWLRGSAVLQRADLHRAVAFHCRCSYKRTARYWQNASFASRRVADGSQGALPA